MDERKVKTTTIEKKYKDKKSGDWKSIKIQHAKVNDRLLFFWAENPNGSIETSQEFQNETVIFKTVIIADQTNEHSRKATGHSYGKLGDEKAFEKLETISVGRALALLGYSASGEVASFEEMEDFLSQKELKRQEKIAEIKTKIDNVKSIEELRVIYKENRGYGKELDEYILVKSKELNA